MIEEFDKELEEDEEITDKQRAKAKWAKLEAIVGNQERVKNLAKDIVTHFEQRQAVFDGKGRWMDNVMIEKLWRSLKYECVYLNAFETGSEAAKGC